LRAGRSHCASHACRRQLARSIGLRAAYRQATPLIQRQEPLPQRLSTGLGLSADGRGPQDAPHCPAEAQASVPPRAVMQHSASLHASWVSASALVAKELQRDSRGTASDVQERLCSGCYRLDITVFPHSWADYQTLIKQIRLFSQPQLRSMHTAMLSLRLASQRAAVPWATKASTPALRPERTKDSPPPLAHPRRRQPAEPHTGHNLKHPLARTRPPHALAAPSRSRPASAARAPRDVPPRAA